MGKTVINYCCCLCESNKGESGYVEGVNEIDMISVIDFPGRSDKSRMKKKDLFILFAMKTNVQNAIIENVINEMIGRE